MHADATSDDRIHTYSSWVEDDEPYMALWRVSKGSRVHTYTHTRTRMHVIDPTSVPAASAAGGGGAVVAGGGAVAAGGGGVVNSGGVVFGNVCGVGGCVACGDSVVAVVVAVLVLSDTLNSFFDAAWKVEVGVVVVVMAVTVAAAAASVSVATGNAEPREGSDVDACR
jgi:hypothetical protein